MNFERCNTNIVPEVKSIFKDFSLFKHTSGVELFSETVAGVRMNSGSAGVKRYSEIISGVEW